MDGSYMISEDSEKSPTKMGMGARLTIVLACLILLALGLGLGLGLGLKETKRQPCHVKFQFVQEDFKVEEDKIKKCPSNLELKCPTGKSTPLLVVLSLDGLRAEYLSRNITPNLEKISQCGTNAPFMRGVFPTKTYPNHLSISTGLYPESHGIIDNTFYDIEENRIYYMESEEAVYSKWYHGEPIWNTAMKAGKKVVTMMWPGTEADIQDMRPEACYIYNSSMSLKSRIDEILTYFDSKDTSTNPDAAFVYLDQPDSAGHEQGPFGDWVKGNLTIVDNLVARLVNGFIDRGYGDCMNFIVLTDHGMENMDCKLTVNMTQYLDLNKYHVYTGTHSRITSKYVSSGKGTFIPNQNPVPVEETLSQLRCQNYNDTKDWYLRFHKKEDLPKRYHYSNNKYIDEIVVDVQPRYAVQAFKDSKCAMSKGLHGSDNTYASMHAFFLAMGSSFKQTTIKPFENIELYNLFSELLRVKPAPNNGTDGRLHSVLNSAKPDTVTDDQSHYNYMDCPVSYYLSEREKIRELSGLSQLEATCFPGSDAESLDKKLLLTNVETYDSRSKNLPFQLIGSSGASKSCLLVQKNYISSFNTQSHMPFWSSFTLIHNQSASNVLDKKWLSEKNRNVSCARADVRNKDMINYNLFDNSTLGIKKAFLFPPGFIKTEDEVSEGTLSSNIIPMFEDFETGVWKEMMHLVEEYSEKYKRINVITGPIFDYNHDGLADSWQDIKGFVDESRQVPIPTHLFVVISRCNSKSLNSECAASLELLSLILPHKKFIDNCWNRRVDNYLRENVARVKDIELLTGLTILSSVTDRTTRSVLRTHLSEELWPRWSWFDDGDADTCPQLPDSSTCSKFPDGKVPLLVISLDGFRADYLKRNLTPTLQRLHKCGVSSKSLLSIFPSITFPNHYSIISGLYPENHGIIDNTMFDVQLNESFFLGSPTSLNSHWWKGEPLWTTVERSNKTAMTFFWPGADVEILDDRPTEYFPYNSAVPHSYRVDTVLGWLNNETGVVPDLITLYYSRVDEAGHEGGPYSYVVNEGLEDVDRSIKELMDGIYKLNLHKCINVIILSDHGMSEVGPLVKFKDYLPKEVLDEVFIYEGPSPRISTRYSGSYRTFTPLDPNQQQNPSDIVKQLERKEDSMIPFVKQEFPKRFHYSNNDRIDEVLVLMTDPWMGLRDQPWNSKGQHGWDPLYESVQGLFIGWGPSFKRGSHFDESFENIELYNLMSHLTSVPPSPNNGTWGSLHHFLHKAPTSITPPPTLLVPNYLITNDSCPFPATKEELVEKSRSSLYGCPNIIYNYETLNRTQDEQIKLESLHVSHGIPGCHLFNKSDICLLHHHDFVSSFNHKYKLPLWSAFKLNSSHVNHDWTLPYVIPDVRVSPVNQMNCSCLNMLHDRNISSVPLFFTDFASDEDVRNDTFLLTNIVPMYTIFYQEVWLQVLKNISSDYVASDIILGPIFDYNSDGLADKMNESAECDLIPSHYFIIIMPQNGLMPNFKVMAFIFPNSPRSPNSKYATLKQYLFDHKARIRDVELLTGLQFLTNNTTSDSVRTRTFISPTLWI